MLYTIENEKYIARISSTGAELHSLVRKADSFEYIWQADPAVWGSHAPLLFPFVGRLKDESYEYEGVKYPMTKHGFARKSEFDVSAHAADSISLQLDGDKHLSVYPFDHLLEISFTLKADCLEVMHRVINRSDKTMYFSIGAHPGFNCSLGDYIEFPADEEAWAYRLGEGGLLTDQPVALGVKNHRLTVDKDVFKDDALIFIDLSSRAVTLHHNGQPHVTVEYDKAPCLGIWAKPGAEYVCIEPWYGVDDGAGASGILQEKNQIATLRGGETFLFPMTVKPL